MRVGGVGWGGVLCHSVLMTAERLNGQVRLMLMNGHYRPETGNGKRQGDSERETKRERRREKALICASDAVNSLIMLAMLGT